MLQKLSISNYALIDNLEIDFGGELNIITGETGAGKSIILGALSLILGQRAESKYFFNQEKKCVIEGLFILADTHLQSLFQTYDLDFYTETILRREISIDGKSRAFINDTPVNLSVLKTIGEHLIAIHSQHASQEINDTDFQLLILDSLAGHQPLLQAYKKGYAQLKQNQKQLKELQEQTEEAKSRQDYEQFLFNELKQAALIEGEQEELERKLERLTHAESIKRSLLNTIHLLDNTETTVLWQLKEAHLLLNTIEKYDSAIANLNHRLKSAQIEIKDIVNEIEYLEEKTEYNPQRLEVIQQRLDLFYTLQQKHRVGNNTDLIALQKQLSENLQKLVHDDEKILELDNHINLQQKELQQQALTLQANREKAITLAEKEISHTLKQVNMPHAQLSFQLSQQDQLHHNGLNQVQLLFTANIGQPAAPINKIASGGELSRLMLAVKTLLAKHTALPTLIFDEIDTGISGETALKVGEIIERLSKNMQILAITHLPQIAAKGHSHFLVYKNEKTDKTTTSIKKLTEKERITAIAEMLSGKNPGASALQHAKELLG